MTMPHYDLTADEVLKQLGKLVTAINRANGWYDTERPFDADVALLHTEVSEMYEAFRKNNWNGLKDSVQDELADVFIRLLDTCARYEVNLYEAFTRKCYENSRREYRHGGKIR